MQTRTTLIVFSATVAVSAAALADWPNGDPTKYVQLPDRQPTGIDVMDTIRPGMTFGKILADDFPCYTTGPITDIHIWGSWLHDILPINSQGVPDPTMVRFKLSIHSDIPAGPTPDDYSRPANPPLWQKVFVPGTYASRVDGTGQELFYDPNTNEWLGTDNTIWQYNFDIPEAEAFIQEGTTANPKVYWLDVQAQVGDQQALFGWKTSQQHWNDDAVWGDAAFGSDPPVWNELRYPMVPVPPGYPHPFAGTMHPMAGQSMDLAFAITTVPEPSSLAVLALGAVALLRRRRR